MISIIVPVYNAEKYLNRCIDSILQQTYTDFELILVNDGSTDTSPKILNQYAELDPRCIVENQANGGHASARNKGIDIAFLSQSEYITFIDSDDWIDPNYLEYLLQAIQNSNSKISACSYCRLKNEGEKSSKSVKYSTTDINTEEFWCNDRITATIPCAKLYDKQLFNGVRWPNKVHDDEHMTYKLLFQCKSIPFVDVAMYNYYYNPESVMVSNWSVKRTDSVFAIKERREFFKNRFPKAYELDNKLYISELYDTLCKLEPIKSEHMDLYSSFKKELRTNLKKFGNVSGFGWSEAKYMWLYAFPSLKLRNLIELAAKRLFKRG